MNDSVTGAIAFERDFVDALLHGSGVTMPQLARQPAFAVYRNTVMKACIDALEANFPAVVRLVGRDWFRAAAAVHVAASPPRDPRLLRYGDSFPGFLEHFEPASGLPYLPAVALLDQAWTLCHAARDATPLDARWLNGLPPDALGALGLQPHPAARWHWCAEHPAYTLWSCNRIDGVAMPDELPWHGEGALLTRPGESVQWHPVGEADCAFLDACARGLPLGEATGAALAADAHADVAALLVRLIGLGAFASLENPS
ncbi:DNA-binding domain-containing protein [Variovorax sp. VNK109]|uniref:HvfC/BufC N-terminal domain-containing protein n=1 Tax=Variovorax sp. VNK109 TaxID=3400919 RepID=UPI003C1162B9